ncbi:MAG: hypothetical protein QOH06_3726 [Acidobacteriota bacterium]|jgi:hypothetical protein|nr:hypothetical protein [Acidobacteriota bacterium]
MTRPYLGITGFTSAAQVREALALVPPASRRLLMVGVLASRRTCAGLPERSPRRLPAVNEIPGIFPDHPLAVNLVHYYTDEPATIGRQLSGLARRCGPNLHGFQINGVWPSRQDLEEVRSERPGLRIVIQMEAGMLAGPLEDAVGRAREIAGLADDLLLDASGGQGRPLDPAALLPFLRALADTGLGLGVAGGLSASNLQLLEPLLAEFPDLSFDAETCLRDEEDWLDLARVREYVRAGLRLVS